MSNNNIKISSIVGQCPLVWCSVNITIIIRVTEKSGPESAPTVHSLYTLYTLTAVHNLIQ